MRSIRIKVIPGARENKNLGERNGFLVIKLTTSPEKGRANKSLIDFLAGELGVRRSQIVIVSGKTSHYKEVLIKD